MSEKIEYITAITPIPTPFIQIFALYVIMHGHYSPGGGFQGGVILGASFILLVITQGLDKTRRRFSQKLDTIFCSIGLLVYSGIGMLCLIIGGNYLDYSKLSKILPVLAPKARSLGILGVEIGVGIGVMAVMYSIFSDIVTGGEGE